MANQILGSFNQLYLKSNKLNQRDFLYADIECRKVKGDLNIFSWVGPKILSTNQMQNSCSNYTLRKMGLVSMVFCTLIEIQRNLMLILKKLVRYNHNCNGLFRFLDS